MSKLTWKDIARLRAINKKQKELKERKYSNAKKLTELIPEYFDEALWAATEAMEELVKADPDNKISHTYHLLERFVNDTNDFRESLKNFELKPIDKRNVKKMERGIEHD